MKTEVLLKTEIEVKTLQIKAGVRYWEDATVNGVEDTEGSLIPFRNGDYWEPEIDVDNGTILNWPEGMEANIHYKVCDDGDYYLKDSEGKTVMSIEGDYVPNNLIPGEYGDYIILDVDRSGKITNWLKRPSLEDFEQERD